MNKRHKIYSVVVAFAALTMILGFFGIQPAAAAGTTYFVSSSLGSDSNAGTSSSAPFQTLAKVNSLALAPGDTVKFRRGDTWTGGVKITASGTSAAKITLGWYGSTSDNRPTVTGGLGGDCFNLAGSWLVLDNLKGVSCGYAGAQLNGSNESVHNSSLQRNAAGIQASTGSNGDLIFDNTLTNNNVLNQNSSSGSSGAFGILLNGNNASVHGNHVTGSDAASLAYGRDGSAVEVFNGSGNKIYKNFSDGNNALVELGGSACDANQVLYNRGSSNNAADTQATGIVLPGSCTNTTIEHNSVWLVGATTQALVCYNTCAANDTISDNVFRAEKQAFFADGSGWAATGNVVNGPSTPALGGTNTTAAAALVSPPGDLHPTASSPAVDRATSTPFTTDFDGKPVPSGAAPDSGAYELQQTADTVPPTVSMTAPADGATVSGTVPVSADASDNVGVAGVQFKLDGANFGAEDTASPYTLQWDTSTVANGTHTLTAVARDAAGNTATAIPHLRLNCLYLWVACYKKKHRTVR